jgi:hypothetical protein
LHALLRRTLRQYGLPASILLVAVQLLDCDPLWSWSSRESTELTASIESNVPFGLYSD